jgi:hypothetical protein
MAYRGQANGICSLFHLCTRLTLWVQLNSKVNLFIKEDV